MIEIEVSASHAALLHSEVLTAGRVGLEVRLHFDAAWQGLLKVAVIEGSRSVDMLLRRDGFTVPSECLGKAGDSLRIGLYGISSDGLLAIPTLWVNCGEIRAGVRLTEMLEQGQAQTVLAQILSQTAAAAAIAAQLQADAENGRFTGEKGDPGPAGISPRIQVKERMAQSGGPSGWDLTITDADGTRSLSLSHGACFIPSVSASGVMSWSNIAGLNNPPPVDLVSAVLQALDDGDGVSY